MQDGAASAGRAEWVLRVLGVAVSTGASPTQSAEPNGLAAWQAARATAISSLKALEGAFRKMNEPEVTQAVILLRAIQANLTERPTTRRQVEELKRYISDDDIIEEAEEPNGFGITVSLHDPLMAALAQLQPVD